MKVYLYIEEFIRSSYRLWAGQILGHICHLYRLFIHFHIVLCCFILYTLDTVYFRSQSIFVSSIANLSAIGAIFTFCLTQRDESTWLAIEWLWWLRPTECQTTLQAKVKYIKIVLHAKVVDWSTGVFILWKKLFSIIPSYGKSIALGWTI